MKFLSCIANDCKSILREEDGNISTAMTILLPVILLLLVFFETRMQARYIYIETKSIFDFAVLAGADEGKTVKDSVGNIPACTIEPKAGKAAVKRVLEMNIVNPKVGTDSTKLPAQIRQQIYDAYKNDKITGMTDRTSYMGGYAHLQMTVRNSNSSVPVIRRIFNSYRITIDSTARCHPYKSK